MASEKDPVANVVSRVAHMLSVDDNQAKTMLGAVAEAVIAEADSNSALPEDQSVADLVRELRVFEAEQDQAAALYEAEASRPWDEDVAASPMEIGGGIEFSTHGSGGGRDD